MATSDSPLNVPNVTLAVARGASSGGGDITLPAANLYKQTFESKTPDPGDLNTINFSFGSIYNDLVTDLDGGTTGGQVYKTADGIIDPPNPISGKDWRAKEGDIALRVSCAEQTGTGNAEQNAESDPIAARDTWVRFWMRIPTNYAPTTNHGTSQHKIFVIFQDGYSGLGDGSTCFMNIYHDDSTDRMQAALLHSIGGGQSAGGVGTLTDLFHATTDRGRWMQFVFLHRLESSPGAGDGEHGFWARFEDETSFSLIERETGLTLKRSTTTGLEGFRRYRFLSAREGDAAERQDFLFDVIEVADQPLVPAGTEGL